MWTRYLIIMDRYRKLHIHVPLNKSIYYKPKDEVVRARTMKLKPSKEIK
jgi:predicted P-loop ATPase/GTPase